MQEALKKVMLCVQIMTSSAIKKKKKENLEKKRKEGDVPTSSNLRIMEVLKLGYWFQLDLFFDLFIP